MFDQLGAGWGDLTDWISQQLGQIGAGHLDPAAAPPPPQPAQPVPVAGPPPGAEPQPVPVRGPDWPILGGAIEGGVRALEALNLPGNAVRSAVVQGAKDVGEQGLAGWAELLAGLTPTTLPAYMARHPDIAQAGWEGLTGQRLTDATELPGVRELPDEGPSIGPVHITPRTVAGFAAATVADPLTYVGGAAGRALEAVPGAARLARPVERAIDAGMLGVGGIQGAELAGLDPETGQWDPARTAAGAVGGLVLPHVVPRAIGATVRGLRDPELRRGLLTSESGEGTPFLLPEEPDRFQPDDRDRAIARYGPEDIPLEDRARQMAVYRAMGEEAPTVADLGVKPGDQVWVEVQPGRIPGHSGWQQSRVMGDLDTGRIFPKGVDEGKSLPIRVNLSDAPLRHVSTHSVRLSADAPSFGEQWLERNPEAVSILNPAAAEPAASPLAPTLEDRVRNLNEQLVPPDQIVKRLGSMGVTREMVDRTIRETQQVAEEATAGGYDREPGDTAPGEPELPTPVAQSEPARSAYPLPAGNFGPIQDEGQLLSRVREVANKPDRGIRLDFDAADLTDRMEPGVHAQAQLEAVQRAAEREGFSVKVEMSRPGRRRGTAWLTVTGEQKPREPAVLPMTTPTEPAGAAGHYQPPTPPARPGQAPETPRGTLQDQTRLTKTPGGQHYVNNWDNTGGRSFPAGKNGLKQAQTYFREQRQAFADAQTAARKTGPRAPIAGQPYLRLGRDYGVGTGGNRFREVYVTLPGSKESFRIDVRVRTGTKGSHETRAAEVRKLALAQLVEKGLLQADDVAAATDVARPTPPTIVDRPFAVGHYVQVTEGKRAGHAGTIREFLDATADPHRGKYGPPRYAEIAFDDGTIERASMKTLKSLEEPVTAEHPFPIQTQSEPVLNAAELVARAEGIRDDPLAGMRLDINRLDMKGGKPNATILARIAAIQDILDPHSLEVEPNYGSWGGTHNMLWLQFRTVGDRAPRPEAEWLSSKLHAEREQEAAAAAARPVQPAAEPGPVDNTPLRDRTTPQTAAEIRRLALAGDPDAIDWVARAGWGGAADAPPVAPRLTDLEAAAVWDKLSSTERDQWLSATSKTVPKRLRTGPYEKLPPEAKRVVAETGWVRDNVPHSETGLTAAETDAAHASGAEIPIGERDTAALVADAREAYADFAQMTQQGSSANWPDLEAAVRDPRYRAANDAVHELARREADSLEIDADDRRWFTSGFDDTLRAQGEMSRPRATSTLNSERDRVAIADRAYNEGSERARDLMREHGGFDEPARTTAAAGDSADPGAPAAEPAAADVPELGGSREAPAPDQPGDLAERPVSEPRSGDADSGAGQPRPVPASPSDGEVASQVDAPVTAEPPYAPLAPVAAQEPAGEIAKAPPPGPIQKPINITREEHTRSTFLEPDELEHVTRLHDAIDPLTGHRLLQPVQVVGVSKALVAMNGRAQAGSSGFILLDGMGVGKSRQMLATGSYYADRGHPVIVVTPSSVLGASATYWTDRSAWTGSFRDDARALGLEDRTALLKRGETATPGNIWLTTYDQMKLSDPSDLPFKLAPGAPKPVLIFDEAHSLRKPGSKQTQASARMLDTAHAVLFATATPFDKGSDFDYLARAGVFEPDLFATKNDAYLDLGMKKSGTGWTAAGNEIIFNARLDKMMDRLTDKGLMVRREFGYKGVDVGPRDIEIPQAALDDIATVGASFAGTMEDVSNQRAILEPHKVAPAIRQAQEALTDPHRQVVIFTSAVSPREFRTKHYARDEISGEILRHQKDEVWVDPATGEKHNRKVDDPVIDHTEPVPLSNGSAWIPGPIEMLREGLIAAGVAPNQIAEIHGGLDMNKRYMAERGITEKPPKYLNPGDRAAQMERFQKGEARVVLVSIAAGGTGVNLDDRAFGGVVRPRETIFLNPDWQAALNVQATGRVWRLTTASFPKITFLRASNAQIEQDIFRVLGRKFATLGAAVSGDMIKALGPEEMKRFLKPSDESRPLDFSRVKRGELRQVMDPHTGEVRDIASWPTTGLRFMARTYEEKGSGVRKVGLKVKGSSKIEWVHATQLAFTPEDAARLAIERTTDAHLPLAVGEAAPGARVWDLWEGREMTVVRVAQGPGRLSLLEPTLVRPPWAPAELYQPSRYVMVRPSEYERASVRFIEDLRSLRVADEPVAATPDVPAGKPPDAQVEPVPDIQQPAPPVPESPGAEGEVPPALPTQEPGAAGPTAVSPPTATPPAPPALPPTPPTPPPGAAPLPVAPGAGAPPGPAATPPGAAPPGGGLPPGAGGPPPPGAPPPGGPPGGGPPAPGAGPPPVPPAPPPAPGTALERVYAMLNRVRTPVTMSRREWFANLVREAGRQVADRAQPLNQATGRAIKAAGAAGLDPEKQFELQNGLYGGRFAAIPVAIKRGLLPIYDRMRQQGLMDAQGQPDPLNAYRKGQRDLEIANARGGARAASAGITDTTKAQEILDQLRTDLGPTKFGELERADLAVQEFVRDTRQLLVAADPDSAGMITQELADMLDDEHPHYNPTLQVKYIDEMSMPPSASGGDRVTQNRNTLKRLADEGGLDDTEPAMSSVIRMRAEVEYAVRRNKVAYAAVETLRADPLLGPYMERKPIIRMEKSVAGDMTALWQQGDRKGAISAFRGGKRELWGLADNAPEPLKRQFAQMEEIIKGDDVPAAGLMATWARKANAPLKWGATTLSVPFQLRNAVRDSINLFIQHGFGPIADLPNQFRNALTKSPEWEEAMRQGGGFESLFNQAPADLEHAILQSGGLLVRNPDDLRNLMDKVWQAKLGMIPLTAAIENAPRLAARKALLKRGMTGEEATLYGYRRVTVDWNRAGAALKQINPFILFANARVQGSLNMGRILRDSNAAKMRLGGLAAVAVAAYFWNKQQPGYADIPDYVKNQSMVFLLPGASQDEQGNWENLKYVAVPLGEWAAFTAPIGMLLEHMEGTDQRGALDLLGQELQLISPGPMPFSDPTNFVGQVLPAPLRSVVELSTNRRFWSNTPIVPRGMENLPTQEQIAPYTSQGSIFAANLAARLGHPVSPMDLDFFVKENLGGLGTMLLGMSDGLAGKAPDTLPLLGSITSGVYRTYGGQQQQDRYELAGKLQAELANTAVEATKALPAYQQASPQTQRQMLVAAQDELKRATMQAEGITPATAPGQLGLPPKFAGVPAANQRAIDEGISAVTAYMTDPLNKPMPSREQLDNWAQYHGKVDPAYTAAVKARSQSTDSARGAVTQIVNNAPPPAVGSDAEALQRAGAIKAQLDSTARYVNVRTGQAVGTPQQWDQWDQWLSRYNSLPATDPQRRWLPNQTKLRYADQARLLLAMQNQQRLRMSLEDASYQRYYGLGKGLSEEAWQQIRSTPKYKDLPAGSDQQAAARDAFLASYRKLPPRDPRRLQYRLIATRYQRMLNPAYAQIVPTARFVEQYGVGDLSAIETPAA